MPLVISTRTTVVAYGDGWGRNKELLIKAEDVIDVGDEKFYIVKPHSSALVKFVVSGAPGFPARCRGFSLAKATRYKELIELRNAAAWPTAASYQYASKA